MNDASNKVDVGAETKEVLEESGGVRDLWRWMHRNASAVRATLGVLGVIVAVVFAAFKIGGYMGSLDETLITQGRTLEKQGKVLDKQGETLARQGEVLAAQNERLGHVQEGLREVKEQIGQVERTLEDRLAAATDNEDVAQPTSLEDPI